MPPPGVQEALAGKLLIQTGTATPAHRSTSETNASIKTPARLVRPRKKLPQIRFTSHHTQSAGASPADIKPCRGQDGPDLCGETGIRRCGLRPSGLDTGPRPLTEAAIGFQRQRPEMVHQRTLVRGSENHWGRPKTRRAP